MSHQVGIVVIGRNEGERLRACLESLDTEKYPVVYVDSGSTDGSVNLALQLGAEAVELDMSTPFTAARARNAGYRKLLEKHPSVSLLQFIDGDCTLAPDWINAAAAAFGANPKLAAVNGHLQERHPEKTIYNKLCQLEWRSPAGIIKDYGGFGGIAMIRADVLEKMGGYNPEVIAGEDSELGVRISLAGYQIEKLDHPMATHDANMRYFSQWWKRSVRAGHAIGQRAHINGDTEARDNIKEKKSTIFWGMILPLVILLGLIPTKGLSLILLGGYVVLGYRIYKFRKSMGDTPEEAFLYARYNVLAKFANAIGLVKFFINQRAGRYEIIEYKHSGS